MKKLLFILSAFFAVVACDNSEEYATPVVFTPAYFEIEANTGGTYAFTTDVPAYVRYVHYAHYDYYPTRGGNKWERPKTLPATHELGWFSITQLTDTTFEVTIGKEHDSNSILEIYVTPYVSGAKSDGEISFFLQ